MSQRFSQNSDAKATQYDFPHFERHVARLLIVLYHAGKPLIGLFDGVTHEVVSRARLGRFDFWVREPGHLALALLHAYTDGQLTGREAALHAALDRMLAGDAQMAQVDLRRVALPGSAYNPSRITAHLDALLAFLTARALASDRPSFAKNGVHRIILETQGAAFTEQMLENCPSLAWYRAQCETVAEFFPTLERYDLAAMPYLAPELTPALAVTIPLTSTVRARYAAAFTQ